MEKLLAMARLLTTQTRPTFVHGHWRKPAMSRRRANVLRKQLLASDVPAEAIPAAVAAKPMRSMLMPPKGHKADRERAARLDTIQKNVARMQKTIADFKKDAATVKEKARPELPF